jgi:hypothetical protein
MIQTLINMKNEETKANLKQRQVAALVMLPCPFCGSGDIDPSMVRGYKASDQAQPIIAAGCWDCGSTGPSVDVPDHSTGYREAADRWNARET